jgi:hypothetical protein
MSRNGWISLLIGIAVGLAAGMAYAWAIDPVEYLDTAPASLRSDFRADYMALIASAYSATGDLPRARARMALLTDSEPADTLAALAQQGLAQGRPQSEVRALAILAAALSGKAPPAALSPSPAISPTLATRLPPTVTPTLRPTATRAPSPTAGAPFQLASQKSICDPAHTEPLIMVTVSDAAEQGIPGLEIEVFWDSGQDHFFTGLKPELGAGYGDFTMSPDTTYAIQLAQAGAPITGLRAPQCTTEDGRAYTGSLLLEFAQPGPTPGP